MLEPSLSSITTDKITLPVFQEKGIEADVLRLDKIHPIISGNKWFKLHYYIEDALRLGKKTIATYGGAWSNHLLATSAAAKMTGLNSFGIVRGERPVNFSNTLTEAEKNGMHLIFMNRADYREKRLPEVVNSDDVYVIPEGGYGVFGAKGAETIFDQLNKNYTHICTAVGTGTTFAGLINRAGNSVKIIGISVVDDKEHLPLMIDSLIDDPQKKSHPIIYDYTFGGYAKKDQALIEFINKFYRSTGIPSDFVYTGKLFFAILDLAMKDQFPAGSSILMIHTGGLQGNASLLKGTLIF